MSTKATISDVYIYIFSPGSFTYVLFFEYNSSMCTYMQSQRCGVSRRRSEGQTCMGSRGTCTLRGHPLSPHRPWTDVAGQHTGDASLLCLRGNRVARRKYCLPHIQRQTIWIQLNVIVFASVIGAEVLCFLLRPPQIIFDSFLSWHIFLSSKNQLPHDATAGDKNETIHQILVNFRSFLSLFLFWQRCSCNQKLCQKMCDGARK